QQFAAIRDYALVELGRPVGLPPRPGSVPFFELYRAECLALARLDSAPAEAEAALLEAAAGWHGHGLRYEVRCRWMAGEAAARAGATQRALAHLLLAERIAARDGLAPMLGRIRRSLRPVGVRRAGE